MEAEEVRERLASVLESGDRGRFVRDFLAWGLSRLSAEHLRRAVEEWVDPVEVLGNHFKFNHPLVRPVLRLVLRLFWREVEEHLCKVARLYDLLAGGVEGAREVLDTPEGRAWLNAAAVRMYSWLYHYVWPNSPYDVPIVTWQRPGGGGEGDGDND